jgi:hypothetical protein
LFDQIERLSINAIGKTGKDMVPKLTQPFYLF